MSYEQSYPLSIKVKTLSFKTPHLVYALHRFLFRLTNGGWNRLFGFVVRFLNGKYKKIDGSSDLFPFTELEVKQTVKQMLSEGYCFFPHKLPLSTVSRLVEFSKKAPLKAVLPNTDYAKEGFKISDTEVLYSEIKGKSARCHLEAKDLYGNEDIHQLMTDPNLLRIAQEYLGAKPILGSAEMWWSFPVDNAERFEGAAAQKYHFDMDHVNFFNIFFYLTDVDENNGPHCLVKSTHRWLPKRFRRRGRFEDSEIKHFYKQNDILEVTGKKGSVIAVDTRCLHKGKVLKSGERLILQLHFTTSLFGKPFSPTKVSQISPERLNFMKSYPETYFHYL
jgi:hypothetical protein